MAIYPFYETLKTASQSMLNGNFGLWYNKYVPLSNNFKASDDRGIDTRAVEYYFERYGQMAKSNIAASLKRKHDDLTSYCDSFPCDKYEIIQIEAALLTPLITGIGESHPNEISLVFDHNLGIPYIPASGVKGIVRFAHTLSLLPEAEEKGLIDEKGRFDDEAGWTFIVNMFGAQTKRGQVVFLDAYSKGVPQLHIDIMNPHYGPYYSDGLPPADHHNPTPIKFLTVAPGTTFIFRAIAKKEKDLPQKVHTAIEKALTVEGVGAKTAIGYGRFTIDEQALPATADQKSVTKKIEQSPLERCCTPFETIKPNDAGRIGPLIDTALKTLTTGEDKKAFAKYVKEFMGSEFKKSKAREKLKGFLA